MNRIGVLVCALLSVACGIVGCLEHRSIEEPAQAEVWFKDVTAESGIDFKHRRGPQRYWLPEIMSGGGAWLDYDNDGDLDLYLVQSGDLVAGDENRVGNMLYRNTGQCKFQDVSASAQVDDRRYGMGVAVGDFDNDQFQDIYVTNLGRNTLFRNQRDGSFVDVTDSAGVGHTGWGTSAAFVDYDADGDLDLFVVNYLRWTPQREIECTQGDNQRDYCTPNAFQSPATDVLYRNRGDGTFEDVTQSVGLNAAFGNGLGVATGDFNQDGRVDFYVANDGMPNQLWIQDAQGSFRDVALGAGCSVNRLGMAEAGMGVAAVDIENDGDLDLFMTHLVNESNTLYLNHQAYFDDSTAEFGLSAPSIRYTGFGLGFADFDNDGRLDLFIANGRVGRSAPSVDKDPYAETNQLFRGVKESRFEELQPPGGTDPPLIENSRAAILGDCDNDGDIDVLVVNNHGAPRLLENQVGTRRKWVRFAVRDKQGGDALGALVRISSDGRVQWRMICRAYGYQSSHEAIAHFGVGSADQIDSIQVVWPSGETELFPACDPQQLHQLVQGTGQIVQGTGQKE